LFPFCELVLDTNPEHYLSQSINLSIAHTDSLTHMVNSNLQYDQENHRLMNYLRKNLWDSLISSTLINDCVPRVHNQNIKVEDYENGVSKQTVTYAHDALGRRINKTIIDNLNNETQTNYLYDGQEILAEYDDSSLLAVHTHSTLRTDDTLASDIKSTKLANNVGSYFFLKDSLGSIIDITDSSGNIVQHYVYSSFGEKLKVTDNSGNEITPVVRTSFGFTNREHDAETGLMHYRARVYMPEIGRFMQEDPDQGVNTLPRTHLSKYMYSLNNPIRFKDPSGRIVPIIIAGLIAGSVKALTSDGPFLENFLTGFAIGAGGAAFTMAFATAAISGATALGFSGAGAITAAGAIGGAIGNMAFAYTFLGATGTGLFVAGVLGAIGGGVMGMRASGQLSGSSNAQSAVEGTSNAPRDAVNGLDFDVLTEQELLNNDYHTYDSGHSIGQGPIINNIPY
jgi:RHS repeat-associated protein